MKVRIEFAARERPPGDPQILWADMTPQEFDRYNKFINDPAEADRILYIPSRVHEDGPTKNWMFEAGRIKLRQV